MLAKAALSTERYLYTQGLTRPEVRKLVLTQLAVAAAVTIAGGVMWAFGAPVAVAWSVALGAALASINFLHLSRFVQEIVFVEKGAVTALLIRFYGRLILTGAILYGCIAYMDASVAGLLAGLSTVVPTAVFWGLMRHAER